MDTLQNRGPVQLLADTCVAAVVAPYDLSGRTKVRWVLHYLYNCNSVFTSFIYQDGQRLDGFYIICIIAVHYLHPLFIRTDKG